MTKKIVTKIISIFVVLSMLMALCFTLISCGDKGNGSSLSDQYNNSIDGFKTAVMAAKNADWGKSISDAQLAQRADAGEYILYDEGLNFLTNVFRRCGILPQQIDALKELFEKPEVKEIFKELGKNENGKDRNEAFLKVLLPLLRNDFSSNEVASLFYEILHSVSEYIDSIFFNVYVRGKKVYDYTSPSNPNKQLNDVAQIAINIHKYFDPKSREVLTKQKVLLKDLENAKEGIMGIGRFAYDVVFNSLYDNIKSHVGENGALVGITENEIKQTLLSVLDNFKELREILNPQQMEYINIAFSNILNTFSGVFLNDGIISQLSDIIPSLITQINSLYFSLDLLPTICDVVVSSESMIKNDSNFVNQLFNLLTNDVYNLNENKFIMLAKFIDNIITTETDGTKEALINKGKEFINGLFTKIDQKENTPLKDGSLKIDKMVGVIGLDLIIQYMEYVKDNGTAGETIINNLFEPMMVYGSYKRLRIDYNAAKAGIRVGKDVDQTPFRSVYFEFRRYEQWLLSPLGVYIKDWPSTAPIHTLEGISQEEQSCKKFILGVLGSIEDFDYDTSLYKYLKKSYDLAKTDLLNRVEGFSNDEYLKIKELATYDLFQNSEGVKESKEYLEVVNILNSLGLK